ncbi:sphinganine kinase lcb4 [Knufia obscura]|uniref:Sphinganine kinase lcb4 n=1 Tax=Knufia obscura TaxID=1635080 RepID=A0ABR0S2C4_9EURO|nr:sphinganine kinase lcb4 [Knufia obscura]
MSSHLSSHTDPFSDTAAIPEGDRDTILESTLHVGANASLTLGADRVIVADDAFDDSNRTYLCGLIQKSDLAKTIPFYHILDAELLNNTITIRYVRPRSSKSNARLLVRTLIYPVSTPEGLAQRWTDRMLERAFGAALRRPRIKVLINPFGGAGRAQSIYDNDIAPIFQAAGCTVDVQRTTHKTHAVDIAADLDIDAYDVLACASGDGLPMECFNGLARKGNAAEALRKIAVTQLPCGTGNAMSWNFFGSAEPSVAALSIVKAVRIPFDLASVTQGDKRTLSFLSQSLGIVAETDLGTENIRWMGDFRFTFGFLVRLLGKNVYPIDYAVRTEIEDKNDIKKHYAQEVTKLKHQQSHPNDIFDNEMGAPSGPGLPPLKYGTIKDPLPKEENSGWTRMESYPNLGNFYCGNMCWMAADAPFFPASLPSDGMMDLVTIDGDISRLKATKLLLAVADGTFFDDDIVRARKISAVRVIPRFGRPMTEISEQDQAVTSVSATSTQKPSTLQRILKKMSGSSGKTGYFSVDGEKLPFEPFQVEIHRGLATTLSRVPGVYEYEGPRGWKDINVENATTAGVEHA